MQRLEVISVAELMPLLKELLHSPKLRETRDYIGVLHFGVVDIYGFLELHAGDQFHELVERSWNAILILYLVTLKSTSGSDDAMKQFMVAFEKDFRWGVGIHLSMLQILRKTHIAPDKIKEASIFMLQGAFCHDLMSVFILLKKQETQLLQSSSALPTSSTNPRAVFRRVDPRFMYIAGWAFRSIRLRVLKAIKVIKPSSNQSRMLLLERLASFTGNLSEEEKAEMKRANPVFAMENRGGLTYVNPGMHEFCSAAFLKVQHTVSKANWDIHKAQFPKYCESTVLKDSRLKQIWATCLMAVLEHRLPPSPSQSSEPMQVILSRHGIQESDSDFIRFEFLKKLVHVVVGELLKSENSTPKSLETETRQRELVKF